MAEIEKMKTKLVDKVHEFFPCQDNVQLRTKTKPPCLLKTPILHLLLTNEKAKG